MRACANETEVAYGTEGLCALPDKSKNDAEMRSKEKINS
jgi:hypothetical protein